MLDHNEKDRAGDKRDGEFKMGRNIVKNNAVSGNKRDREHRYHP